MKRISVIFSIIVLGSLPLFSQNVSIPDANFLAALIAEGVDTNVDGQISYAEAEAVTNLNVGHKSISKLKGIEAFVNIDTLYCSYNQLTILDVSSCAALKLLDCKQNQLTSLDLTHNRALTSLYCHYNQLASLNVSNANSLTLLYCSSNNLTSLDISDCLKLEKLSCASNKLTDLDVSYCPKIRYLFCTDNLITSMNISGCTELQDLENSRNQLTNLEVTDCRNLVWLTSISNQLTSLDVSNCHNLSYLTCNNNHLTSLDLSNNLILRGLYCQDNQLTSLDVSNCFDLAYLSCNNNQISSLNVSNNPFLNKLYCQNNKLTNLDISKDTSLFRCGVFDCGYLDISEMPSLEQVCVWELPFPPASFDTLINTIGSPNVYFDTICASVNINPTVFNYQISIYPNPTDGIITIDIQNPLNADIEIYNTNGMMIYSKPLKSIQEQIDLSAYPQGLYFVKVRQHGVLKVVKVVVR
ncbi:MAG: T9SS type A sorting domain-containing protein [Bacteroidales bacterium]|nr:T9SS type A sorting domain-containing protein [Bacteroidales bacterium]MCF8389899.1 T9SS type A sorting domain-containing protein [Bacteroidales bacterium]